MSTKKPRTTRTKSETKNDFDSVVNARKNRPQISAREQELQSQRKDEVSRLAADVSVEKALSHIQTVNLSLNKTLSSVSEQLIEETRKLENVREARKVEEEELQRLYDTDVVKASIDDLVEEYNQKKVAFAAEVAQAREAWEHEQDEHDKTVAEIENELKKRRERDAEDYTFRTSVVRRNEEEVYLAQLRNKQQQERDRQEANERGWTQRETELKNREAELFDFKKQVTEFPAKLDTEVKREVAIATNAVTREFNHKLALLQKDFDTSNMIAKSEITSLKDQLNKALDSIVEKDLALRSAEERVKGIAEKALDAASGRQALAELSSFAGQRDNGTSNRKS